MGIMAYSFLWVMQDFVHQPYQCQLTQSSQDLLPNLLAETAATVAKPVKKGRGKNIIPFTVENVLRSIRDASAFGRSCLHASCSDKTGCQRDGAREMLRV